MKTIWTIIKKECRRFFFDKRMVATLIVPGVVIYVMYSIMGIVMTNVSKVDEDYVPTAVVMNMPDGIISETLGGMLEMKEASLDDAKAEVEAGTLDVLVVFPEGFTTSITAGTTPNVEVYYNSANTNSQNAYYMVSAVLSNFIEQSFTVNRALTADTVYDLATGQDITTMLLSSIVPMLLFALLASVCMSIAPESIAGEKERGTLAKILITPVKRWQIALGKMASLSVFALISGIVSFLGVILSMPNLVGGAMGGVTISLAYGVGDYFALFGIILSLVLVFIGFFSILSALAKSVKEATSYSGPFMLIIILFGLLGMFIPGTPSVWLHLIPLLGSSLALTSILTFTATPLAILFSIISNLVLAAIMIVALAYIFNNERIMFNS